MEMKLDNTHYWKMCGWWFLGVSVDMQDSILMNLIMNLWLPRRKRVYVELRNMRLWTLLGTHLNYFIVQSSWIRYGPLSSQHDGHMLSGIEGTRGVQSSTYVASKQRELCYRSSQPSCCNEKKGLHTLGGIFQDIVDVLATC